MNRLLKLITVGLLCAGVTACTKVDTGKLQELVNATNDVNTSVGTVLKCLESDDLVERSVTSGRIVANNNYPIVVSIPNDDTARPQSNLNKADVIYEVYAEGSITRLLAVFSDRYPEKVGPVRSGRVYMVDIVDDWNGAFIHFGGAEGGLADLDRKVSSSKIKYRLNGMKNNSYIKRDTSRKAPNNAYVNLGKYSSEVIKSKASNKGPLTFNIKADYSSHDTANEISLVYSSNNKVKYVYDANTNKYNRFIGGSKFIDKADSKQVAPTNVIVQTVTQTSFNDKSGHINLKMTGSGKAVYYVNGKKIEGKWSRNSSSSVTTYYDNNGKVMEFLPGQTFIQVVSSKVTVTDK